MKHLLLALALLQGCTYQWGETVEPSPFVDMRGCWDFVAAAHDRNIRCNLNPEQMLEQDLKLDQLCGKLVPWADMGAIGGRCADAMYEISCDVIEYPCPELIVWR